MSDELNEAQEPLIPDEAVVQEPEQPTTAEVDIEALQAQAAKADEYKKYADRVAAENKELKKSSKEKTNDPSPVTREDYERLDLKTEGYKSDEVDFLMQNGGRKALDNPIVMAGIDAMRKKLKSTEATPSGTNKSAVYQKYGEAELKSMSEADLEKIIPK